MFQTIQDSTDLEASVHVSYLQIYNERLSDLLTTWPTAGPSPDVVEVADVNGSVSVRGLAMCAAASEEEALNLLFEGETNRAVAGHAMSATSSRSHCIFTIHLEVHAGP